MTPRPLSTNVPVPVASGGRGARVRSRSIRRRSTAPLAVLLTMIGIIAAPSAPNAVAASGLIGSGSSFAGIELQEWSKAVGAPPFNLSVNYQSSSSGQGRQNFRDKVVDFAVTDIRYNKYDVSPPDPATFDYIPVTAGGIAFMYNVPGFGAGTKPIQLSSLTVCGIFTGAIPFWDDGSIAADNPGVPLPHTPVTPVVRSDPAGTNFVLEEYCIALHNDLYARFAAAVSKATSTDYPDEPTSNWPVLTPITTSQGSEGVADRVAAVNSAGYITAVESGYATQRKFPVAAVKNDVGAYVLPSEAAVGKALGAATQRADGTHVLNFSPGDAAAYNPSTYSYMLVRVTGIDAAKGAAMTQFAAYCLTIGQSHASQLSYASIGRSLIVYGLDRLKAIPGYVPPTAQELAAIPGGGGTPAATTEITAGGSAAPAGSTPAGVGTGSAGTTAANAGTTPAAGTTSATAKKTTVAGATANRRSPTSGAGAASAGSGASADSVAVDSGATLDSAPVGPLGRTGVEADLLGGGATFLLAAGEMGRRGAGRRRRVRAGRRVSR